MILKLVNPGSPLNAIAIALHVILIVIPVVSPVVVSLGPDLELLLLKGDPELLLLKGVQRIQHQKLILHKHVTV